MEENETSSSKEEVNYRYTEDWKNRCLVRDRMKKKERSRNWSLVARAGEGKVS